MMKLRGAWAAALLLTLGAAHELALAPNEGLSQHMGGEACKLMAQEYQVLPYPEHSFKRRVLNCQKLSVYKSQLEAYKYRKGLLALISEIMSSHINTVDLAQENVDNILKAQRCDDLVEKVLELAAQLVEFSSAVDPIPYPNCDNGPASEVPVAAEVSAKSCEQLGWPAVQRLGGESVCLNDNTNTPGGVGTYAQAVQRCQQMDARVCKVDELEALFSSGNVTGDAPIWSSSDCESDEDLNAGLEPQHRRSTLVPSTGSKSCTLVAAESSAIRCCADAKNKIFTSTDGDDLGAGSKTTTVISTNPPQQEGAVEACTDDAVEELGCKEVMDVTDANAPKFSAQAVKYVSCLRDDIGTARVNLHTMKQRFDRLVNALSDSMHVTSSWNSSHLAIVKNPMPAMCVGYLEKLKKFDAETYLSKVSLLAPAAQP